MPPKLTLHKLAENLIRESRTPFTTDDFERKIRKKWQRKISISTLNKLKRKLSSHHRLIGFDSNDFLPVPAILQKIGGLPLSIGLGKFETRTKVFFPGHRLIPFVSNDQTESDLTFLDPEGNEIPKRKQSFLIEDIIRYYQYAGPKHFPDEIKVNEWIPGKSSLVVTAWDIASLLKSEKLKEGDILLVKLLGYEKGIFQVHPCTRRELRGSRLKTRSLFTAMEAALVRLCASDAFCLAGLEKQLLYTLFNVDENLLRVPVFSLTDFLESLSELEVAACEEGGGKLVPGWKNNPTQRSYKEKPRVPKGNAGSLDKIFRDLGLAFSEDEFVSILYAIMESDTYKLESVFNVLFGGEGKLFHDKHQHEVFYRHLKKLLQKICADLKQPESKLIAQLRHQTVGIKLSLIEMLRFLEANQVGLKDLPPDLLEKINDLDHFCRETLTRLADRSGNPDLKFIRDARLAIKIILPHAASLEEEVFYQLGIF